MSKPPFILHLATDDKFVDQAIRMFERERPGQNFLFLHARGKPRHVRSPIHRQVSQPDTRTGRLAGELSGYDLVVVHSLDPVWWRTLLTLPKEQPVLWLGWGFDYYDLLFREVGDLLLPATREWADRDQADEAQLAKLVRLLKGWLFGVAKKRVIERIDYFAPVLPEEYELVKRTQTWRKFPQQSVWNYGSLEEDLVRGFLNAHVTGTNLLLGNSAAPTNNNLDFLRAMSGLDLAGRKVIAPLSYGDAAYREAVIEEGKQVFGDAFIPLVSFMPLQEYVATLQSCGFAVMNHVRQQALGNIIILLYLGVKVFLRKESPVYQHFYKQGMVLFTMQDLERDPGMLDQGLDTASQERNRRLIFQHWSASIAREKTLRLLEQLLGPATSAGGR